MRPRLARLRFWAMARVSTYDRRQILGDGVVRSYVVLKSGRRAIYDRTPEGARTTQAPGRELRVLGIRRVYVCLRWYD